uniref:Uncharacterized protein n=1 Tax=Rhizophora mucronata TaxID=61149 RepID=A0A2P2PDS0_RHIMU
MSGHLNNEFINFSFKFTSSFDE